MNSSWCASLAWNSKCTWESLIDQPMAWRRENSWWEFMRPPSTWSRSRWNTGATTSSASSRMKVFIFLITTIWKPVRRSGCVAISNRRSFRFWRHCYSIPDTLSRTYPTWAWTWLSSSRTPPWVRHILPESKFRQPCRGLCHWNDLIPMNCCRQPPRNLSGWNKWSLPILTACFRAWRLRRLILSG